MASCKVEAKLNAESPGLVEKATGASSFDPLAFERRAKVLAEAGGWEELRIALLATTDRPWRPRTVLYAAVTATEARSGALLDEVLRRSVGVELPPHIALAIGRHLAMSGEAGAAWGLLLSCRALLDSAPHRSGLAQVLALIEASARERGLRLAAGILRRRLAGAALSVGPDRVLTWDTGGAPPRMPEPGPPPLLHHEAAPPAAVAELEAVRDAFEAALRRDIRPQVAVHEDVLVNRHGQVWREGGEVILSGNRPLPEASLAAARQAPEVGSGVLAMEESGLFHWLCEWLPSLFWTLGDAAEAPSLLLSDLAPSYHEASLALLGSEAPRLRVGDALRVGRLHVGDRRMLNYRHWGAYEAGFRRINAAARREMPGETPADFYISRRDAGRRRLLNEAALIERVERAGFTAVELSGMSLAAQVALFAGARRIVAPHGAGLSHLLAKPDTCTVLELVPASAGSMSLRYNFARISRLRGHAHALHLERINPITHEWSVDLEKVERGMERQFGG